MSGTKQSTRITALALGLYAFALGAFTTPAWGKDSAPPDKPRCGVVIDSELKDTPSVSLFETKLLQDNQVVPVERTDIDKVFQEQKLQSLLGPAAVEDRCAFGEAVRADLLVFLAMPPSVQPAAPDRPAVPGPPKDARNSIEMVICETRHGLRLSVLRLVLSPSAEADCAVLQKAFAVAMSRYRANIRLVIAILPFANQDVSYEYNQLEAIYPQVLAEILLQQPGVLTVEIDEAKALTDELALTDGPDIQRDLPLYINGKYKRESAAARDTIALDLELKRGTQSLDQFHQASVPPDQVPAALRDAARGFLKKAASLPPAPPTTQPENLVEAQELAAQAETFNQVADWAQACVVAEASLLLNPSQPRIHGIAYKALNKEAILLEDRSANYFRPRVRLNEWGNTAMDPAIVKQAFAAFRASLPHLEAYLENTKLHSNDAASREFPLDLFLRNVRIRVGESCFVAKRWMEVEDEAKATLQRVVDYKSDQKIDDDTADMLVRWLLSDLDDVQPTGMLPQDWIDNRKYDSDLAVSLVEKFSFRADPKKMCIDIARAIDRRMTVESRAQIVDRLKTDGYASLAEQMRTIFASFPAPTSPEQLVQNASRHRTPPPTTGPVVTDPDVVFQVPDFKQVGLSEPDKNVGLHILGCMKAGSDLDVFWTQSLIFTMSTREKGTLRLAGGPTPPWPSDLSDPNPNRPSWQWLKADGGCFDGRLAWFFMRIAPVAQRAIADHWWVFPMEDTTAWAVCAYDFAQKKTYWFGKEIGLPPAPTHILALGPGKVIVAGSNGRTWCAILSVDPDKGQGSRSIKTIYEARTTPQGVNDSGMGLSVAYPIEYFCPLAPIAGPGPGESARLPRLLAKRFGANFLLIDPNTPSIQPFSNPLPQSKHAYYFAGKVYFNSGIGGNDLAQILRMDANTLKPDGPFWTAPAGDLFETNGSFVLTGSRNNTWYASRDGRAPFKLLRGVNPLNEVSLVFNTNNYGLCNGGSQVIFPHPLPGAGNPP